MTLYSFQWPFDCRMGGLPFGVNLIKENGERNICSEVGEVRWALK